ncbi:MAG TPA: hypothetical protein VJ865_12395 [Gemmatimonadaceae bacterium]|nr:hypothetical protein [Gemmatimonadaceae bacterium]
MIFERVLVTSGALGVIACQMAGPNVGVPRSALRPDFYAEETSFIRADSEVFSAVIRAQLAGGQKDYPYHLDDPRFDARPYGSDSAYRQYSNDFEFEDSTFLGLIRRQVVARITQNRLAILKGLQVSEGGPKPHPQCPGILVPPPAPGDSASSRKLAELRATCPKKTDSYLTVGFPLRGIPQSIRNSRYRRGNLPEGDVWTTLVEASYSGPSGSMWELHAWFLRRDPVTRQLNLAGTWLIGIVE